MMFVTLAIRRGGVNGPVLVENVAIAGGACDDSPFILLSSVARAAMFFFLYVVEAFDNKTLNQICLGSEFR